MTELSFLIDLLLNHKLPKATKDAVAARIKEVEARTAAPALRGVSTAGFVEMASRPEQYLPPEIAKQAPSMQRIMLKHADVGKVQPVPEPVTVTTWVEPQPVAVVAQNAATAAAMASRNEAIANAAKGKPDASGGKRKF